MALYNSFAAKIHKKRAGKTSRPFFTTSLIFSLIGIHAGLLDDRRPFIDFGFEMSAQRIWGGALFGHRLGAQISESLDHNLIFKCRLQSLSEYIDDRFRRALRRIKSMPHRNLETFQA